MYLNQLPHLKHIETTCSEKSCFKPSLMTPPAGNSLISFIAQSNCHSNLKARRHIKPFKQTNILIHSLPEPCQKNTAQPQRSSSQQHILPYASSRAHLPMQKRLPHYLRAPAAFSLLPATQALYSRHILKNSFFLLNKIFP